MRAASPRPGVNPWESLFGAALGGWLGLALVKFGNPVVLDWKVIAPKELIEFILLPWPVMWGYALLAVVALLAAPVGRWQTSAPRWVVALPLAWLGWQALSALGSVQPAASWITLLHFATCVVCFYLGLFALGRVERTVLFWTGLMAGLVAVVAVGWQQHFGGLEETRRYFYALPDWRQFPPEFLKKVSSNRIYATLFYPNALAGVIILLLPVVMAIIGERDRRWSWKVRGTVMTVAGMAMLGCLYWSESKAGWLIVLVMGLVGFIRWPIGRTAKWAVVVVVLAGGVAGFFAKYSGYFQRGATSVSARFDYWRAAMELAKERPFLGSGPGTFQVGYKRLKSPEAEMARLAHNDYLEQAADSGIPGLCLYLTLVGGSLVMRYPRRAGGENWMRFALWLGLAGLMAQAVVEFPLYIPALAWPMFVFLGWLWSAALDRCEKTSPQVSGSASV